MAIKAKRLRCSYTIGPVQICYLSRSKIVLYISMILKMSKVIKVFVRISALVWNTLMRKIVNNDSVCHYKTTLILYIGRYYYAIAWICQEK